MLLKDSLKKYWLACQNELEYLNFSPTAKLQILPADGVNPLRVKNEKLLNTLKKDEEYLIHLAPYVAEAQGEKLPLVYFSAVLAKDGTLQPYSLQPLPRLSPAIVEPSWEMELILASRTASEQAYQFLPAPWLDAPESLTFAAQLAYAQDYFHQAAITGWEEVLLAAGYKLLQDMAFVPIKKLPVRQKETDASFVARQGIWQRLLDYDVTEPEPAKSMLTLMERNANSTLHTAHVSTDFALTTEQRKILQHTLKLTSQESIHISAIAGSGKTLLAKDLLASLWVNSLLGKTKVPSFATLVECNGDYVLTYQTILDCLPAAEKLLLADEIKLLNQTKVDSTVEKQKATVLNKHIAKLAEKFALKEVESLTEIKVHLYNVINNLQAELQESLHDLILADKLNSQFDKQYSSFGGINQRAADLQQQLKKQQAEQRHLQVLQSLWARQVAAIPKFTQTLGLALPGKRKRLKHLYSFFGEYLPTENVAGLNIDEMSERLESLLRKNEKKQRALADASFQVEADIRQMGITLTKAKVWMQKHLGEVGTLTESFAYLDKTLRYQLFLAVAHYVEVVYLQHLLGELEVNYALVNKELADNLVEGDKLIKTALQKAYFNNSEVQAGIATDKVLTNSLRSLLMEPVDYLFIENSEMISSVVADYCFVGAKRVIALGDLALAKQSLYFSYAIDNQLCQACELVKTEEELEDLDYLGVLAIKGSLNTLYSNLADYRGGYCLTETWDQNKTLLNCYKELAMLSKQRAAQTNSREVSSALGLPAFRHIQLSCKREQVLGSFQNTAEVAAVVGWLKQYQSKLLAIYPGKKLNEIVSIHTPFYAQFLALKTAVSENAIDMVGISHLELPLNQRTNVVIFSPVYTATDKAGLSFDAGCEILTRLVRSAKDHLLIFGDREIFDLKLHSPAGKLANYLEQENKVELLGD